MAPTLDLHQEQIQSRLKDEAITLKDSYENSNCRRWFQSFCRCCEIRCKALQKHES
jgi:hypothetical protein